MRLVGVALALLLLSRPVAAQLDVLERLDLNDFNATVGSGARAWGMGGAFVAVADDATAASWNPSGLAILQVPEITVVLVPIDRGSFDYQGDTQTAGTAVAEFAGAASEARGSYLDYVSFAYPFPRETYSLVPQISYQRAIPRNFTINQRARAVVALYNSLAITELDLVEQSTHSEGGFDVYSGALAVRLGAKFSVGTSLNYWKLDVARSQSQITDQTVFSGVGSVASETLGTSREIDQSGDGFNANLGLMWRPIPALAVGAVYKTAFDLDVDSTQVTVDSRDGIADPAVIVSKSGSIEWPATFAVGVSGRPVDALLLSADYTQSDWSDGVLRLDGGGKEAFPGGPGVASQENTRQIRFGGEYAFAGKGFTIPLRFGAFEDRQILRDTAGDTVDALGATLGVGVTTRRWIVDLAVVRTNYAAQHTAPGSTPHGDGELDTERTRVYLSGVYRFGDKSQ